MASTYLLGQDPDRPRNPLSVYIETTTAGEAGKIDISKIGATFARTWKIKVNYIPCDSPVR